MDKLKAKKRFDCASCEVSCSTRFGLVEHSRKHTGKKPFSCSECHASFKRMNGLKKHIQCIHNPTELKQYSCNECPTKSPILGNIVRHVLHVHRSVKRFICSLCALKYCQSQDLKNHLFYKHQISIDNINCSEKRSIQEVYVLPEFDPKTHSPNVLGKIEKNVEEERKKLIGLEKLVSSLKSESNSSFEENSNFTEIIDNPENDLKSTDIEKVSIPCPEVWISFLLERPMQISDVEICDLSKYGVDGEFIVDNVNRESNEQTQNIQPENCEIGSRGDSNVNRSATFSQEKAIDENTEKFPCKICKKVFLKEKKLQRHMIIHEGEKRYKCETCGKCFTERHNLLVHSRSHTGERPYSCSICEKRMRYHKDFAEHLLSHSSKPKFTCDMCSKNYSRKRDLDRHTHSHRSESRFSCELCGKGFNRNYLKQQHLLKHTSQTNRLDKPFHVCDICLKKFKTNHGLQQHKLKHTGMMDHQCQVCGKAFATALELQTHLRNHIPRVKSVSCSKCQRMFSSDGTLKIHMGRFHKGVIGTIKSHISESVIINDEAAVNNDSENATPQCQMELVLIQ